MSRSGWAQCALDESAPAWWGRTSSVRRRAELLFGLGCLEALVVVGAFERAAPRHDLGVDAHELVGHDHRLHVVDGVVVSDDYAEAVAGGRKALLGAHLC